MPWALLRLRGMLAFPPKHVIWKDPFCTFMLDYFLFVHHVKVVCLVRHPCALFYSIDKQNWLFDIDYIFNQKHLVLDYASDIQNDVWQKARESNAYSIAILWKIMIRMIYRLSLQSSNLLVVRHEDLCDRTIAEGKKICRHFDMSWSDGVLDYVRKSSTSSNIETALGDTKNMDRNSKAITSVWRGKVSEEVNGILRDVIAEDWALYYD